MATTSIWAVKGWLGKVVLYIETRTRRIIRNSIAKRN